MTVPTAVSLGGLAIGMVGTWVTVRNYYDKRTAQERVRQREALDHAQAELDRYAESKTKAYAAERDFGHLMRQYEALNLNLTTLHDLGQKQLNEMESDLRNIIQMINIILLHLGQTETGIQRHLKRDKGSDGDSG